MDISNIIMIVDGEMVRSIDTRQSQYDCCVTCDVYNRCDAGGENGFKDVCKGLRNIKASNMTWREI